jgi:FKBP-type peptidyl-prolyl cis-trans isomerase FkpA
MKTVKILLVVLAGVCLVAGCQNVNFKKTKSGLPYKIYPGKGGKTADTGSILKVHVFQKINDSVMFDSHNNMPIYVTVPKEETPYEPAELFGKLKLGDSLVAVQMMDSFIKRNPMLAGQYKNGDKITTTFKVLDILPNQQAAMQDEAKEKDQKLQVEIKTVEAWLAKNNINAQKTGRGTFVQVLDPGQGPSIDSGKYVTVMYKGKTFDGKVFDTNMDTSFHHTDPLGVTIGRGGSIAGFEDGLKMLKKGGHAIIYIPSMLGFGANPNPQSGIKPFDNLIFDISVVDVKDSMPPPPPMMKRNN